MISFSRLWCSCPFLLFPPQSSSDYVSPYELPLATQTPTDQAKESEAPAPGNEALEGNSSELVLYFCGSYTCIWRSIWSLNFPSPVENAASESTPPAAQSPQSPPEAPAEEAKKEEEKKAEPPQTVDKAPTKDAAPPETVPEAAPSPKEAAPETKANSEPEAAPNQEPTDDNKKEAETASAAEPAAKDSAAETPPSAEPVAEPSAVAVASTESAGPGNASQSQTGSKGSFMCCTHHSFPVANTLKIKAVWQG